MKPYSPPPLRKAISRTTARNCFLINQFATPGLGSLLARRFVAGAGQLLLALIGFTMFTGWFIQLSVKMFRLMNDLPADENTHSWLIKIGALIFGIAWLWALVTSVGVFREAKRQQQAELIAAVNCKK